MSHNTPALNAVTPWPFPPQVQLKERTIWKTEVIRSRAAEQRLALRNIARTEIEYKFQLLPQEIEAATALARRLGADEFLLPFWHELEKVGTIARGALSIPITTTGSRYKVGERVFLMGNNNEYEVATISEISATALTLRNPGIVIGFEGTVVMPCYPVRVKNPFKFKKFAGDYFTSTMEFISTSGFGVPQAINSPLFSDNYVMTYRPTISGNTTEVHTREFEALSNISGPLHYSTSYNYPISTSSVNWSFTTKEELYTFNKWMQYIKGKLTSFYTPRWTRDFIISENAIGSNNFMITDENKTLLDSYLGPICIVANNGDLFYNTVTGWTYESISKYRMELLTPVGFSFNINTIEMITRMTRVRFNSDVIEYEYQSGGNVNVRLPIIEVPA